MARTVIGLSRTGDGVQATLDRAPINYTYDTVAVDLGALPKSTLMERGKALVALLREKDPVRLGIESLLNLPPNAHPAPLYFHVRSETADAVAWEEMFAEPLGFWALDQRCPMGRIADTFMPVRGRGFSRLCEWWPSCRLPDKILGRSSRRSGPGSPMRTSPCGST